MKEYGHGSGTEINAHINVSVTDYTNPIRNTFHLQLSLRLPPTGVDVVRSNVLLGGLVDGQPVFLPFLLNSILSVPTQLHSILHP